MFIISEIFIGLQFPRLYFATNRYLCSEKELINLQAKFGKNSMLDVCEKTLFIKSRTLF